MRTEFVTVRGKKFYVKSGELDLGDKGMFLAPRGEHVLVHETKPERSHAF